MSVGATPISSFLRCPSAWIGFLATVGAAGWLGWSSLEGMIIAPTVGMLVFVAIATHAVARKRAEVLETELVETDRETDWCRSILDGIPGLVWRCDAGGDRIHVSPSWAAATGQSVEESLASGWIECVQPEDRARYQTAYRLAAVQGEPYEVRYRLRRPDGMHRWMWDRATPCFDDAGVFTGFVGLGIDVDHQTDPEQLAQLDEVLRLGETINRQTLELIDRYEQLEQAKDRAEYMDRLKCDYLSALAEDLQAPVDEVGNASELLDGPDLDPKAVELVHRVRDAHQALGGIVERTVRLAALEDENDPIETGEFDMRRLVERVVCRQREVADEKGIVVSSFVDDGIPVRVQADPLRIRRLLVDCFTLVRRVAAGGRLALRVEPVDVEVTAPDRPMIRFALVYNGEGFTPELIERAYYPAETLGGELPGLGLGACRRLVERLDGRIGIQSQDDGAVMIWFAVSVRDLNPNWDGRRTHSRLAQESLRSNLGQVLDLSLGGLRVRMSQVPEGVLDVELTDDEETLALRAEVAWSRRVAFGKHEAGLKFVDLPAEAPVQLSRIATRNRLRRVLDAA